MFVSTVSKMKIFQFTSALFLFALTGHIAFATQLDAKPLAELVAMSEHIIVGHVTAVDMIDTNDNPVNDDTAVTGPGSSNTIRLHIDVNSVLKTNASSVPKHLIISLWRIWNYSLGQVKAGSLGQDEIYLLKGEDFHPVYPGLFRRGIDEEELIDIIVLKQGFRK